MLIVFLYFTDRGKPIIYKRHFDGTICNLACLIAMSGVREQIKMFDAAPPPTMTEETDASLNEEEGADGNNVQEVVVYSVEATPDAQPPDEEEGAPKRSSVECWKLLRSRLLENVRMKTRYGNRLYAAVLELQAMDRDRQPEQTKLTAKGVEWTAESARRSVIASNVNSACDTISKHTSCGMTFVYVPSRRTISVEHKRIEKSRAIREKVCITVDWNGINVVLVPLVMIPLHVLLFVVSPRPDTVMLVFDGSISEKTGQVTLGGGTLLELCVAFETTDEASRFKKSIGIICKLKMQSMTGRERAVLCKGTKVFSELLALKSMSGMNYARRRRAFAAIEAINGLVENSRSPDDAPTLRKRSVVQSALSRLGL